MANHPSHAALPYPIKGARFTLMLPFLDAAGAPTDPGTPDTEISKDGAAYADCTEEISTIAGSNGSGYLTLTGDELNASMAFVAAKAGSGPQTTLATLQPRVLPVLHSASATGGSANTIVLHENTPRYNLQGCIVQTLTGTGGGGGDGSRDNQARMIVAYSLGTRTAEVSPDWEIPPANGTGYQILLTEWSLISQANLRQIHDQYVDNHTATLKLKQLDIINDNGTAFNVISLSNGQGGSFGGAPGWPGLAITSGPEGYAACAISAQGIGDALSLVADEQGRGMIAVGGWDGGGHGIHAEGGAGVGSAGLSLAGGWDGGPALKAEATAGNSDGILATGFGTGKAINGPINLINGQGIVRNQAYPGFKFIMYDANGKPKPGLTVTAQRLIDSGNFEACANSPTEKAFGAYLIDLEATDNNGKNIMYRFSADGAEDTFIIVPTVDP